jgi:hypothetical protein
MPRPLDRTDYELDHGDRIRSAQPVTCGLMRAWRTPTPSKSLGCARGEPGESFIDQTCGGCRVARS